MLPSSDHVLGTKKFPWWQHFTYLLFLPNLSCCRKKEQKKFKGMDNKRKHTHMWQMHLNMHLSKILACILCAFGMYKQMLSKWKEILFLLQCNFMLSLGWPTQSCPIRYFQENNTTFWKIEWTGCQIIFNQEIQIRKMDL